MSAWRRRLEEEAARRAGAGLARRMSPAEPLAGGRIRRADGEFVDLCSNDYLGLARHPEVVEAAREAASCWGAGARASRLVTGDGPLVEELEEELARFKGAESALVFPSGYQANLGLLSLLLRDGDGAFVDRLAHSCLVDGVRLSSARLRVFPHSNVARLAAEVAKESGRPNFFLADGVYSMDGDIAPLRALLDLAASANGTVILDDAHGTGVLGAMGRGTCEQLAIDPAAEGDRLVVVATLSKALGAQGGAVLGPRVLREALLNASRPFVYSTGIAPAAAGAALAALRIVRREPGMVAELRRRAAAFRSILREAGIETGTSPTPIVPVILGEPASATAASEALNRRGILALPIRPPTVPRGTSRLRATVTLAVPEECLLECARAIAQACRSFLPQAPRAATTDPSEPTEEP